MGLRGSTACHGLKRALMMGLSDDDQLLSKENIQTRFWQVSGVPRHLFSSENMSGRLMLQRQDDAFIALTTKEVTTIPEKCMDAWGSFGNIQPKSAITGYSAMGSNGDGDGPP